MRQTALPQRPQGTTPLYHTCVGHVLGCNKGRCIRCAGGLMAGQCDCPRQWETAVGRDIPKRACTNHYCILAQAMCVTTCRLRLDIKMLCQPNKSCASDSDVRSMPASHHQGLTPELAEGRGRGRPGRSGVHGGAEAAEARAARTHLLTQCSRVHQPAGGTWSACRFCQISYLKACLQLAWVGGVGKVQPSEQRAGGMPVRSALCT